jgi:hypothetical protein
MGTRKEGNLAKLFIEELSCFSHRFGSAFSTSFSSQCLYSIAEQVVRICTGDK